MNKPEDTLIIPEITTEPIPEKKPESTEAMQNGNGARPTIHISDYVIISDKDLGGIFYHNVARVLSLETVELDSKGNRVIALDIEVLDAKGNKHVRPRHPSITTGDRLAYQKRIADGTRQAVLALVFGTSADLKTRLQRTIEITKLIKIGREYIEPAIIKEVAKKTKKKPNNHYNNGNLAFQKGDKIKKEEDDAHPKKSRKKKID